MSKYVSIFFLVFLAAIPAFYLLTFLFGGAGGVEGAVYVFGTLIVLLLAFLIAQMYYVIHLLKNKRL